ncbi:MAG: SigE family RNA polymerase sigma factor [Actinobacteria bacterium]|nr:SigE family RNA polymerase sigma factor [Actinomycetota bacterium]
MGADVLSVLRARSEDKAESFAEVFNAHHRRAVRLAYLLTSDANVAEDVVAEAFANVWVKWDKGRVDDVGPYLRRAVVNNIRSRHRRKVVAMREAERRSGDARGVRTYDEDAADRDELWQALQRLPDRQRAAIVLRYYEDLSEADTAEALGVSVGTVKSQVSRGMDRLRELLAWTREDGPDDGLPVPGGEGR